MSVCVCPASIGIEKNTVFFDPLKSQNVYKTKQQIPSSKQQQQQPNCPIPFCSLFLKFQGFDF